MLPEAKKRHGRGPSAKSLEGTTPVDSLILDVWPQECESVYVRLSHQSCGYLLQVQGTCAGCLGSLAFPVLLPAPSPVLPKLPHTVSSLMCVCCKMLMFHT